MRLRIPTSTFSNEQCQPLPSTLSDSAHWTCREKITATVSGSSISNNYDITFSFAKRDGSWQLVGDPDFKKVK